MPAYALPSVVPLVPVHLDRERHLRLTNAAIFTAEMELSRLWGKKTSLFAVLASPDGIGLNDLSILLWAALLHESPGLTVDEVQTIMPMQRLPELIDAILRAWNLATQPAEAAPQEPPNGPLAIPSTGLDSGAMPAVNSALASTSSGV